MNLAVHLCNFVINEFNSTFEVQGSGNMALENTLFQAGIFKTDITFASGLTHK